MVAVLDIYKEYKVFSILQEHQLRVAALGSQICDSLSVQVDKKSVVEALLFHDMGNLVKVSDFTLFPETWEPEGAEHWKQVKQDQIEKYGDNAHVVTEAIVDELSIGDTAKQMVRKIGFTQARQVLSSGTIENKICSYADQRVGPRGVLPLLERIEDLRKRYETKKSHGTVNFKTGNDREEIVQALVDIEAEIFSHSTIAPEDINDESIAPVIEKLKVNQVG